MDLNDNKSQDKACSQGGLNQTLTSKVGRILQLLAQLGDQIQPTQVITPFHSTMPSNIPVQAYFLYVSINSGLSDQQAIVNLVLIERICKMATARGVPIVINSLTIHRLILASVLITSKFYNDIFYGNHYVAYVGGVQLEEINLLEVEFLNYIDWCLWVDTPEYELYLNGVHQHFEQIEMQQQVMQNSLVPQGPQAHCRQEIDSQSQGAGIVANDI